MTSALNLTKKESTGLTRFNPYVQLDNLMYVKRDPEVSHLTDAVQSILDKEMRTAVKTSQLINDEVDLSEVRALGND